MIGTTEDVRHHCRNTHCRSKLPAPAEPHQHVPAPKVDPLDLNREFVLGAIKGTVFRIDEIRQEVINAGIAVKNGAITPQDAIDWVEEVAPGCLGHIPPTTGLKVKQRSTESLPTKGTPQ
jgi:hypothetical protein